MQDEMMRNRDMKQAKKQQPSSSFIQVCPGQQPLCDVGRELTTTQKPATSTEHRKVKTKTRAARHMAEQSSDMFAGRGPVQTGKILRSVKRKTGNDSLSLYLVRSVETTQELETRVSQHDTVARSAGVYEIRLRRMSRSII